MSAKRAGSIGHFQDNASKTEEEARHSKMALYNMQGTAFRDINSNITVSKISPEFSRPRILIRPDTRPLTHP